MARGLLLLALLVVLLAGCAGTPASAQAPAASPRARCVVDPRETGTRPLIFLLCIESP